VPGPGGPGSDGLETVDLSEPGASGLAEPSPLAGWAPVESVAAGPAAEGFQSTVIPKVELVWPRAPALVLHDAVRSGGLAPAALLEALPALWGVLATTAGWVGLGCLTRESVRWGDGGWQLAVVPWLTPGGSHRGDDADTFDPRGRPGAWSHDRYAVACGLVRAVIGRWPTGPADALELAAQPAEAFCPGLDAVVNALLHDVHEPGDVTALLRLSAALAPALAAPGAGPASGPNGAVAYRCFRETMVGSAKARGRMGDNEDLAAWSANASGSLNLALLDGITGSGDGSGWRAVRAAMGAA
jgi:hypothetical protein